MGVEGFSVVAVPARRQPPEEGIEAEGCGGEQPPRNGRARYVRVVKTFEASVRFAPLPVGSCDG